MSFAIASPKNVRALETLIREHGLGETLQRPEKLRYSPVPSGVEELDARLGGGLPRGSISEVTGRSSSGRTGLVLAALSRATQKGDIAAYVDATDCLDPSSAEEAGVALERLLWIRCGEQGDEAWQAANLVVAAGAFGVVAVDLGGLSQRQMGRWQRRPWMRLKHALESTSTALVVLAERHLAGSAADMVLELRRERTEWDGLLGRVGIRADVVRDKVRATDSKAEERAA
jgi:hypothetical protein